MKMFREKKKILVFLLMTVLILLYLFRKEIRPHLKDNEVVISNENKDNKAAVSIVTENNEVIIPDETEDNQIDIQASNIWENISYEGNRSVTDNPWNMTVGRFEMDGEGSCILLTPNTSMQIENRENQYDMVEFMYQIHPAVKEASNGAGILIWVLNGEGDILFEEKVSVKVENDWKPFKINLEQYSEAARIKIICNNGDNGDDGDWVIIKFQDEYPHILDAINSEGEGYVKSATYFAEEWPVNFWNSEMDNLENDMAHIKNDGFNSIILVIPWREFQPDIDPIRYNENVFTMLGKIMKAADRESLDVYVRIGYTWDYYNDVNENIVDRFCMLLYDDQTKKAWLDYVSKMYDELCKYDNFAEGFLTWEDFWNNLGICDDMEESKRVDRAHQIGYGDWVKQIYSLEEYNARYGTEYNSYDQIAVPRRNEPAMYAMFEYYDNFLMTLLEESQKRFPNLSMEVRLDYDVTYNKQGELEYYKHTNTFPCGESSFTATMYGIPMGFENVGEKVSYQDGLEKTEHILNQLQQQNENKPIYVEQFIFADNTPAYKNNAQIKDDEIDDYLEAVSDILLNYTSGYGIWTYRNYCANMIYNPQFALKENGWKCEGGPQFVEYEGSMVCKLNIDSAIFQEIPPIRNHFINENYRVSLWVKDVIQAGTLRITIGDETCTAEIDNVGIVEIEMKKSESLDIKIESIGGSFLIDDLKLYSQIQEGFLYDENGDELSCAESVRILNMKLQ